MFLEIFFNYYLKSPKIKDGEQNLAEFLDFDSAVVLDKAITTDDLLLKISNYAPAGNILIRIGISPDQLKERSKKSASTGSSKELVTLLTDADNLRRTHNSVRITLMDLIASLFDYNPTFKQLVIDRNLDK